MLPQIGRQVALGQQSGVAVPLYNPALIQNKNLVSTRNCAQPLGDHQHRVVALKALDRLLHQPLALGIQGIGSLIENQHLWIAQDCARQAQALPLAATEPVAPLAHQGVVALRQALDETLSLSCLAGGFHLAQRGPWGAKGDVCGHGGVELKRVLAYNPKPMVPAGQFQLVQWCVVHLDLACGVALEAREQVGNGARTGAARVQQRQHLTSWQRLRWPGSEECLRLGLPASCDGSRPCWLAPVHPSGCEGWHRLHPAGH